MRVLYVTHNAIGSALVRSQVLPYLHLLASRGHEIDLVTFERGEPYPENEFPRDRWHPLRPRPGRSLAAKVFDIARGTWMVAALAQRRRAEVLHARSYLPAAICWIVSRLRGIPYVFDMRGFLGEEYLDAGIWEDDDLRYRALRSAEHQLLRSAAHIVVLTHAAERRLHTDERYVADAAGRDITVIPCAVDLERFRPSAARRAAPTLVYSGSLGMWYLLDEMIEVYASARRLEPGLRFLFLNRGEHVLIRSAWSGAGLPDDRLEIRACDFSLVPRELEGCHVAIALLRQVTSKVGSSPIKIGEYLACGLPVIVNEGLGDSDEQIRDADAGHVVSSYTPEALARAGSAVAALVADDGARRRARVLAERTFDARDGARAYDEVYAHAVRPGRGA